MSSSRAPTSRARRAPARGRVATSSSRSSRTCRATSPALSTVIHMRGGGDEGVGEDVTYDALDHVALQDAGPVQRSRGSWTLGAFCEHVGELDLFPAAPRARRLAPVPALGLRERRARPRAAPGGHPLPTRSGASRGRSRSSCRCGSVSPPTIEPVRRRLERYPTLRFKLDPTSDWSDELIARAGRDGRRRLGRLQGLLQGHGRRPAARPRPLRRVVEAFPDAWIEDPALTDETRPVLGRTRTASPGTRRSTRSPTSRRCRSRRGW